VCAPLLFVAAFVAAPASSQTALSPADKDSYGYSEPYCSDRGHRFEMGELSCLRVDGRVFLARCGMLLNNPAWQTIQDSCPASLDKLSNMMPATTQISSQISGTD
jgi:hypothetical protein